MITVQTVSTRIDIDTEVRKHLIALLNQQLADAFDLYSQIKYAHWNVKGMQFYQLHELFDKLAAEVEGYVDLLAERVTALGGIARGTARMAVNASRLPEYSLEALDGWQHVTVLAERFASYAATTRVAIDTADDWGDANTADLLREIGRGIDKALWFLEAHIQVESLYI
jgi:starvation-inducible DNA-binding protein